MPTPAHDDFDSTKPSGASSPTVFSADLLKQLRALRDMDIAALVLGFVQSRTQGTGPDVARPQYISWINSALAIGFRWKITWTGFQPTTVQLEWSNDTTTTNTWTAVGAAQVNTFDGADNITASTNSGGAVNLEFELWAKVLTLVSQFNSHGGATGTSVHGLGTASTANLSAMAISGTSSFDGTGGVGQTTRAPVNATRVVEDVTPRTPALNAGVSVDWASGGTKITHSGINAITFANIPTGEAGHVVDVSNLNQVTWPAAVDWGVGGLPSIAGRARVILGSNDAGAKVFATIGWRAV